MSLSNKRMAVGVQVAIMVAFLAVFLGAVSLVGGGFDERGARFWTTVVSIIFATIVWFNVPIWMVASDARNKDSFPFQFTAITFCTMYAAGVFTLALVVLFSDISSGWVLVAHMALLFFLAASLGVYSMANRAIEQMDAADRTAKAGAANLNSHAKAVRDRASMCEVAGAEAAQAAIVELAEAMHYATGESLPGSEAVDAEITAHFKAIELALMDIDDAEGEEAIADLVTQITREVKSAKLTIKRREDLMKTLR
jgi:hypothetical protein